MLIQYSFIAVKHIPMYSCFLSMHIFSKDYFWFYKRINGLYFSHCKAHLKASIKKQNKKKYSFLFFDRVLGPPNKKKVIFRDLKL